MVRTFTSHKKRHGPSANPTQSVAQFVASVREEARTSYREQSLRMHGWVCGKCGREFELANLHLLTVHHRDGNHHNNPRDGSNWENLCVYCHEDEHARLVFARGEGGEAARAEPPATDRAHIKTIGTLGELLASKGKGRASS